MSFLQLFSDRSEPNKDCWKFSTDQERERTSILSLYAVYLVSDQFYLIEVGAHIYISASCSQVVKGQLPYLEFSSMAGRK